jgi:WD40 repeat protein
MLKDAVAGHSGAWERIWRYLVGDDIFIAYSRADGATYAASLGSELANHGFTCRLDLWGTQPGSSRPVELQRALKRSNLLVLVGTVGAAGSRHVFDEVEEFRQTQRPIIPILFEGVDPGGAANDATQQLGTCGAGCVSPLWADHIRGLPLSREKGAALTTGTVSADVTARIEKAFTFTRRDRRLRIATQFVLGLLVVLVTAGMAAGWWATIKASDALRAERDAERSQQIALARRNAAAGQNSASSSPALLQYKMLLSADSIRRFTTREAHENIWRSVGLMPIPVHRRTSVSPIEALTSKAGKIAFAAGNHVHVATVSDLVARQDTTYDHGEAIKQLMFGGDARHLASASSTSVRLWDLQGTVQFPPLLPAAPVQDVSLAIVDQIPYVALALASADGNDRAGSVELYAAANSEWKRIALVKQPKAPYNVAISAGSSLLAMASGSEVRVWSLGGNAIKPIATFDHEAIPLSLSFSGDGRFIGMLGADDDPTAMHAYVWDLRSKQRVQIYKGYAQALAFSPDGRHLAVATPGTDVDGSVVLLFERTDSGFRQTRGLQHGHSLALNGLAFGERGGRLTSISDDGLARIWNVDDGMELGRIAGPPGEQPKVTALVGDEVHAVSIWNNELQLSRIAPGIDRNVALVAPSEGRNAGRSVFLSPAGDWAAVRERRAGGKDWRDNLMIQALGESRVWRISSETTIDVIGFTHDSRELVFRSAERVRSVSLRDGVEAAVADDGPLKRLIVSHTGKYLVEYGGEEIRMRDRTTLRVLKRIPVGSQGLNGIMAVNSDDTLVAFETKDVVRVADVASGREVAALPWGHGVVFELAFSPSSRRLAMVRNDGRIVLFPDLKSARAVEISPIPTRKTPKIAFAGEDLLISVSTRGAQAWDISGSIPSEVARLDFGAEELVGDVALTEDGTRVMAFVSAKADSSPTAVRIWNWLPDALVGEVCKRASRNVSQEEWKIDFGTVPYCRICPNIEGAGSACTYK